MAKKKAAEPTVEVPAETAPEAPTEKMTQREAVEMALKAGKELPADGVPYVLKEFNITLSNQAFSTIKSKINTASKTTKKPGRPAASTHSGSSVNNGKASTGGSSSVGKATNAAELALAVKTLVKQYGAEAVADMTKVFAD